jgi:hypothetical protein
MEEKIFSPRPVECYYILCFAGEENWNITDAISAILIDLYDRNLIVPATFKSVETISGYPGLNCSGPRHYEELIMMAIKAKNYIALVDIANNINFRSLLLKTGLLEKKLVGIRFFRRRKIFISSAGDNLVHSLLIARESHRHKEENHGYFDLPSLARFPSLQRKLPVMTFFHDYAAEAVFQYSCRYSSCYHQGR